MLKKPCRASLYFYSVSVNKHQNYATFNNNPYITASHQAGLIVHVSVNLLLGLGSDVGIIIKGSIILMFVHRNCYR